MPFPSKHLFLLSAACLILPSMASGQTALPDAGRVLRDNSDRKLTPPPSIAPVLPQVPAERAATAPGGPQVLVSGVRFTGNTVFSGAELQGQLDGKLGAKYDLAGMKQLAEAVTDFYRAAGYPFARVLVPVQEFGDGVLELRVMEGRYFSVLATGRQFEIDGAKPFLAGLRPGELIYGPDLEMAMLILDDLPGVSVSPSVSPGAKLETADLAVGVLIDERRGGDCGVDNHGSRFTGRYRVRAQYFENSAFAFGDHASVDFIGTNHEMLLGSLSYERPLDGSGLKGEVGFSNTRYMLGEDYAAMGISGLARVWSAKGSLPLHRSQAWSVFLSLGYQHKSLHDNFSVLASVEDKSSDLIVSALRFDVRDGWGGGGLTYGMLTATYGRLNLFGSLTAADEATAHKAGDFGKVVLDAARIQSLPAGLSAYVHGSAQWADGNLDSSEKLGAGGADGVRSYPLGEATGDVGWMLQAELRLPTVDAYAPYFFYDACRVRANYRAWDAASAQIRSLSGYGVGVRSSQGRWSSDLAVAWRGQGGAAQSDGGFGRTTVWFSLGRSF